jgi:GH15 family glucan-1,4-alpha-glucosidase
MNKRNLNYGIIGNCRSSALIREDSSIDWCCLPQFDSDSIFCEILDEKIGGSFKIKCDNSYQITQKYFENTCVLQTTFSDGENEFDVIDFMPRFKKENGKYYTPPEISRILKLKKGSPKFKVLYDPRLAFASGNTKTYKKENFIVSIVDDQKYETLFLYSNLNKDAIINSSELVLKENIFFVISYNEKINLPEIKHVFFELDQTKIYWKRWCNKTPTFKQYNNEIIRSAMTLKLLNFEKTGAIIAAATTSIPEAIGEVRNWDYRFCWIRDASMVIKVISKMGHVKMVKNFIDFILNIIPDKNEKLQIMYGISGEKNLHEETLDYLSGFQNSKPVRTGNAAYHQKQNDIYGILMDAIHFQIQKYSTDDDKYEELWSVVKSIIWVVKNSWKDADKGIWEIRGNNMHFTFSKLLCWVAVDRAIKISKIIQGGKSIDKWVPLREEIYNDLMGNAWNENKQAFTQTYGSKDLDASVLLMEDYGFIKADNPKYISTVKAIEKELLQDGLMYRYKNKDDFGLPSSSFTVCTFWMINSLHKIGEREKAQKIFNNLISYSNHLNLFSEDIDFKTKDLLGNFPQAYSHLALIDTAISLNS